MPQMPMFPCLLNPLVTFQSKDVPSFFQEPVALWFVATAPFAVKGDTVASACQCLRKPAPLRMSSLSLQHCPFDGFRLETAQALVRRI